MTDEVSAAPKSAAVRKKTTGTGSSKTMSIGVVLEKLRAEFPDVTVSKIRFLESEGLVTPQRTASGYRRFTAEDVQRLRYILVTQRDNYLPLKVIREQLEAMDSGQVTAILTAGETATIVDPESFRAPVATRLTDSDVAEQAGVAEETVAALIDAGLITPDAAGFFTADDVSVVTTADALHGFGIDVRHLRSVRNQARRQADLIVRAAGPLANSSSAGARQRAEETAQQLSALLISLDAALIKNALREEL